MLDCGPHFISKNEYVIPLFQFNKLCFNQADNHNPMNLNESQVKHRTRFPFSLKEDQLLMQLVKQFGIDDKINWYIIAMHIEGRTARQCRERYQLFLSDGIKRKEKWTKEEDEILLEKYSILGPKWKKMEKYFQGRTSYSIKNRFISLKKQNIKNELNKPQNNFGRPPPIVIKRYCLPLKFNNVIHQDCECKKSDTL